MTTYPIHGAGLGLRRDFLDQALTLPPQRVDFWEIAPENWIGVGGALGRKLRALTERTPFVCHGLSLSLGGPESLDEVFLCRIKGFLETHGVRYYTEHLSYCSDGGHLYDLMPIPFTSDALLHVAARIRRVQEILERRIGIENVSYYAAPGQEMSEIDFLNGVLAEADCDLHLDVNNLFVNAANHGYDAEDFLARLPGKRIAYCHVAGHYLEPDGLRVDTHGAAVIDPVWSLLRDAYQRFGVFPTLLERDFNIPPLDRMLAEVDTIAAVQHQCQESSHARHARA